MAFLLSHCRRVIELPGRDVLDAGEPGCGVEPDATYRTVLGEPAWRRLPAAVRARFAVRPLPGEALRYEGVMEIVRRSPAGLLFALVCRLIGTPLAPYAGRDVPVAVTLRRKGDGIAWERLYRFPGRPALLVRSTKQPAARGGLLECVGGGFGMRLRLTERDGALHFISVGFFSRLGPVTLPLPVWLTPGRMHVVHSDEGGGWFRFRISVVHPVFGETFFQDGRFTTSTA